MPHVITQSCCSDASCVYACPVNCIQPTPGSPEFLSADMLSIDPATCVDCGACVSACPVGAISPASELSEDERIFAQINADYFTRTPLQRTRPPLAPVLAPLQIRRSVEPLRVAIVGSGPAAMYAADEILTIPGARVDIFERLSAPYGLARFGVAPDHRLTRQVTRQLDVIAQQPGITIRTNAEVGVDMTHEDLLANHHAVIYAVGASDDRRLDIPGMDIAGTASATEFVAWYNGHPDHARRSFDPSHRRAVVIGNGNVALDVARILTADPDALADSDIAPAALHALRGSCIEEVVVVGRRGPAQAAFTLPELVGLRSIPGVQLTVAPEELAGHAANAKTALLGQPTSPRPTGSRRITLRFLRSPTRVLGTDRVEAIEFDGVRLLADASIEPTGQRETIEAGLVLTSIGYRGRPLPGLPFDEASGTVPNLQGRVIEPDSNVHLPGTYVAGWIKRGPTGFIGTNRSCSQETVAALVADHNAGRLAGAQPALSRSAGTRAAAQRDDHCVGAAGAGVHEPQSCGGRTY